MSKPEQGDASMKHGDYIVDYGGTSVETVLEAIAKSEQYIKNHQALIEKYKKDIAILNGTCNEYELWIANEYFLTVASLEEGLYQRRRYPGSALFKVLRSRTMVEVK